MTKFTLNQQAMAGTVESSDIQIMIDKNPDGGIEIELKSNVEKQYGKQIRRVITETLHTMGIEDAKLKAQDQGALDCTIKARVMAAVHRASGITEDYNWGVIDSWDRLRRTMMFVPASNPGMLRDAILYGADSIMFDLEDSISLKEKDSSRFLVYMAVKTFDYKGTEIVVRINDLDAGGRDDVHALVGAGIDCIRLPKTTSAQDVLDTEAVILQAEKRCGRAEGSTSILAAIEDPEGVLNALSIATSSPRLIGIALGAEDYVTSMKTRRYPERGSDEIFFARSMIVHAARTAGIAALDTVFSDVNDMDTLRKETEFIKQLGFDGKSVINPRQIAVVNDVYTPTVAEIDNAIAVLGAIEEAEAKGSGVIALNGRMIDKPIVERAQRVISLAKAAGLV